MATQGTVDLNTGFEGPPATVPSGGSGGASGGGGGAAAPAAAAATPATDVDALANAVAITHVGPTSEAAQKQDEQVIGDDSIATVKTSNLSVIEKKIISVDGIKIESDCQLDWADLEDEALLASSGMYKSGGEKVERVAYPQYAAVHKSFIEEGEGKKAYDKPSEIQCLALPRMLAPPGSAAAHANKHMIFQAPTGTGKTGAFVGAVLCTVDTSQDHVQALILAPTRFVAQMHAGMTRTLGKYIPGLKVMAHYKCTTSEKTGKGCTCAPEHGSSQPPHAPPRGKAPDCHVLCGTVGKLFNYTGLQRNPKDKKKKASIDLSKIKFVVVDEADELFSGNGDEAKRGATETSSMCVAIKKANPDCRFILASATAPKGTKAFYEKQFPDANTIYIDAQYTIPATITLARRHCPKGDAEKNKWVVDVVENVEGMERMIIFATTHQDVMTLQTQLEDGGDGLKVSAMHGGLSKHEQDEALRKFKDKESVVLVSSAIIGRGVDIEGVTHVVLYQPPTKQSSTPDLVSFVHKIGRCGRAGSPGTAVVLTSSEQDKTNLDLMVEHYKMEEKTHVIESGLDGEDAAEKIEEVSSK